MRAEEAFTQFARRALSSAKAERLVALSSSRHGQREILGDLYHVFGPDIRQDALRPGGYDGLWDRPCYVFHDSIGFGVEFASLRDAYGELSDAEGWLIVLHDASSGIHRPERWDEETLIVV